MTSCSESRQDGQIWRQSAEISVKPLKKYRQNVRTKLIQNLMAYEPKPGEKLPLEDFKNIVTQTPLVSIDLIVRQADGRVWLGRRSNQPAKGTFFVPGGRITKNETRTAAFERITLAELGVQIKLSEATFLGPYDHIYKEKWFEDVAFGTN